MTGRAGWENSGLVKNTTAYKAILLKVLRGVEVQTVEARGDRGDRAGREWEAGTGIGAVSFHRASVR